MSSLIGMEDRIYTASNYLDEAQANLNTYDMLISSLMVSIKAMENQYGRTEGKLHDDIGKLKWIACEELPRIEDYTRNLRESFRNLNKAIMEYRGEVDYSEVEDEN